MCRSEDPAWPPTSSHCLFPHPLQCDDMIGGLPPSLAVLGELKPPQKQNLMAFLQLVGCSMQGECLGPQGVVSNQKLFSTAYFLVSALAGMEETNFILYSCCFETALLTTVEDWYLGFPTFSSMGRIGSGGLRKFTLLS